MENSPDTSNQTPSAQTAAAGPTVNSLQEAMMTHLLKENEFLRAQVEQHARAEAELRAALRETMRAMPKAMTTGRGEDKVDATPETVETAPPVNITAQIEERIAATIPKISPTSAPQPTPVAPTVQPVTPVAAPIAPAPVVQEAVAPVPAPPIPVAPVSPAPVASTPVAPVSPPVTPTPTAPIAATPVSAPPAPAPPVREAAPVAPKTEEPTIAEALRAAERPRREARPIVAPPLMPQDVYVPKHQPGEPVALKSAINELSRRRTPRPLWKKVLGMR